MSKQLKLVAFIETGSSVVLEMPLSFILSVLFIFNGSENPTDGRTWRETTTSKLRTTPRSPATSSGQFHDQGDNLKT
jgi:hypothetical protein